MKLNEERKNYSSRYGDEMFGESFVYLNFKAWEGAGSVKLSFTLSI